MWCAKIRKIGSRVEVEVFLVERASHLEDPVLASNDALGKYQRPLVGAHVLGRVPFLEDDTHDVYRHRERRRTNTHTHTYTPTQQ